jgi:hypothetical protein
MEHVLGLIWPLRGLTRKGEGTNVGAGCPGRTTNGFVGK